MPTPLEILLDPISLGVLALYLFLMTWENATPARELPKIRGWIPRALGAFVVYFFLSTYLLLLWDGYLAQYQLLSLGEINIYAGALIGVLVFEGVLYAWHRTMHNTRWLWLTFHQMHHSAERMDTFGAFYFSPLDMIGFTFIGSLSLSVIVGLPAESITLYLFITVFLAIFQHANIKTPQWLGYIIQRPESHSVHHEEGIHAFNYSDLPIFDILFGTFRNPNNFSLKSGFYTGASARIPEMMIFKDISKPSLTSKYETTDPH